MKQKYNLAVFETAFEGIENCYGSPWTCNQIRYAEIKHGATDSINRNFSHRKLFETVFDCADRNFNYKASRLSGHVVNPCYSGRGGHNELVETRLLALCFAYEIARLKNNKKSSGF